jgi:hypothetical protein
MISNRHLRATLAVLFLVSALVLASCEERAAMMEVSTAPIRAWVGGPMDGVEIPMGANSALCHAFAIAGVSQAELYVNGSFANGAANPNPSEDYFTAELSFNANAPGAYVLECVTTDQNDLTAWSESVTVFVTGEEAAPPPEEEIPTATPTETGVPTATPTSTGVPTDTPTSTGVPTNTPTSTGIPTNTPTFTATATATKPPPPVKIVSYEVSKSQINLGECVTFSWVVEGSPDEIYFDGQGATSPDSEDRCPTSTKEFELVAYRNEQVADRATLTVVVRQPSPSPTTPTDREGPRIYRETGPSSMVAPMGGYCREPYDFGAIVRDDSGVRWVKLICSFNKGPEQSCGALQLIQTDYYQIEYRLPTDGSVQYGDIMHWHIRACDTVDPMNCTDSPSYHVTLGACII